MVELNRPGGAAQLQDGLVQHQESRGTDRMSAGDQSSGDVHRDLSVPGRRAGGSERASRALLAESEVLHEVDLGKGGGVVELHEVEVLRRATGHRVGRAGSPYRGTAARGVDEPDAALPTEIGRAPV